MSARWSIEDIEKLPVQAQQQIGAQLAAYVAARPATPDKGIDVERQINLIVFSNNMFKNARPMTGIELEIMEKVFSETFSKTPTRL